MRFLTLSLALALATVAFTACNSKSSSSSNQTSTSASAAATEGATSTESSPAASAAAGTQVPSYPGATTEASGSTSNASGTVMSTTDSFDKVYGWYQQHMPAGSEKSHTTAPVESAVFTIGDTGNQTSVTITTQGAKTMITVGKVSNM